MKDLLTSGEAAQKLKCSRAHVTHLCRSGDLTCIQDGKNWRVEEASIEHYQAMKQDQQELLRHKLSEARRKEYELSLQKKLPYQLKQVSNGVLVTLLFMTLITPLAFADQIQMQEDFKNPTSSLSIDTDVVDAILDTQNWLLVFNTTVATMQSHVQDLRTQTSAVSFSPVSFISFLGDFLWSEPYTYSPPPLIFSEPGKIKEEDISEVVQQVVQREPTAVIQNITQPITYSGVSREEFESRLNSLAATIPQSLSYSGSPATTVVNYQTFASSQKIDQLDGVSISNATVSGISGLSDDDIPDGITVSNYLPLSGGDLTGAVTGTDLTLSGTLTAGTLSVGGLSSGAAIEAPYFSATTTASSTFVGGIESLTALSVGTTATTTIRGNNASSTFAGGVQVSGLSVGSLSGFLKGIGGYVTTSLIDLAADVSGILAVANGGTGWGEVQANTLLLGNGTSQLATTSAGTNGQVLTLVGGVPSWVATTTFSSPLVYSAGNVTVQDAAADGSTKGASTFTAADFTAASGVISIDYANGQEATSGQDGFLSSTDWSTFNNKLASYDAWTHGVAGYSATTTGITIGGNLGVGTTSPDEKLVVYDERTETAGGVVYKTLDVFSRITPSSASSGDFRGGYFELSTEGTEDIAKTSALSAYNYHRGSGDITDTPFGATLQFINLGSGSMPATGVLNTVRNEGTGTITSGVANSSVLILNNAGATITTGVNYSAALQNTSGTIANWYGFYAPVVSGTAPTGSRYPLYLEDTGIAYIAGSLGVGDNTPDGKLEIRQTAAADIFNLYDNTTNVFTVLDGGNVGIGTTTPDARLTASVADASTILSLERSDVGTALDFDFSGALANFNLTAGSEYTFSEGGDEHLRIDASGNVGIGTTTPGTANALARNLVVGGSGNVGLSIITDGGAGTNSSVLFGDYASPESGGITYAHDTNDLYFATNGFNERMRITAAGNVGIGTTSPTANLHVSGAGTIIQKVESTDGHSILEIIPASNNHYSYLDFGNGTDFGWQIGKDIDNGGLGGPNAFYIYELNTGSTGARFAINSGGNVGIGTTSPQTILTVHQTRTTEVEGATLMLHRDDVGVAPGDEIGAIAFSNSDVSSNIAGTVARITAVANGTASNIGNLVFSTGSGATSLAERMRITAAGNVGIGDTSPAALLTVGNGDLFQVNSSGITTMQSGSSVTTSSGSTSFSINAGSSGSDSYIQFNEVGTLRWRTFNVGSSDSYTILDEESDNGVTLAQDGTSWSAASDVRLKENIHELTVLDKLEDFRAVSFDWKTGGKPELGVIAQEVHGIFPELVNVGDDTDDTPSVLEGTAWNVTYDRFGALALQGLKELYTLVIQNTEKIGALAEKVMTKEIYVSNKLCIGATCITETELQELLSLRDQTATPANSGATGDSNSTTPDTTPPTFTINGNNPAHVDTGITYADLGALVSDNVDTNLGITTSLDGVVVTSVNIDTTEPGEYTITYSATDQAGNTGEVTRTVIVGGGVEEETPVEEDPVDETESPEITPEEPVEEEPEETADDTSTEEDSAPEGETSDNTAEGETEEGEGE